MRMKISGHQQWSSLRQRKCLNRLCMYHAPITKEQVEPIRFSYYGGLGAAFKVANRIELVPEMHYRVTNGFLYRADFPFNMKLRMMDFRLGLTYYF